MGLDPAAANESAICAIGLIVAQSDAIAAGVASLPGPITDPDARWLWVHYAALTSGIATAQVGGSFLQCREGVIDSKAMRRTTTNDTLLFIFETAAQGGTPNCDVGAVARVLIQEG